MKLVFAILAVLFGTALFQPQAQGALFEIPKEFSLDEAFQSIETLEETLADDAFESIENRHEIYPFLVSLLQKQDLGESPDDHELIFEMVKGVSGRILDHEKYGAEFVLNPGVLDRFIVLLTHGDESIREWVVEILAIYLRTERPEPLMHKAREISPQLMRLIAESSRPVPVAESLYVLSVLHMTDEDTLVLSFGEVSRIVFAIDRIVRGPLKDMRSLVMHALFFFTDSDTFMSFMSDDWVLSFPWLELLSCKDGQDLLDGVGNTLANLASNSQKKRVLDRVAGLIPKLRYFRDSQTLDANMADAASRALEYLLPAYPHLNKRKKTVE